MYPPPTEARPAWARPTPAPPPSPSAAAPPAKARSASGWLVLGVGALVLTLAACMVVGIAGAIAVLVVSGGREHKEEVAYAPAFVPEPVPEIETPTVLHPITGQRWSDESLTPMRWEDGTGYCATLAPTGGWRMPSEAEVRSLVDPAASGAVPLHEPFRSTSRADYLWTGEEVPGRPGHPWIMNLTNGHVFNGSGYEGLVRCVRR